MVFDDAARLPLARLLRLHMPKSHAIYILYNFDTRVDRLQVGPKLLLDATKCSTSSVLIRSGVASSRVVIPQSLIETSISSLRTDILLARWHFETGETYFV